MTEQENLQQEAVETLAPPRSTKAWPLALCGLICAILGFVGGYFYSVNRGPDFAETVQKSITEIENRLSQPAAMSEALRALDTRLAQIETLLLAPPEPAQVTQSDIATALDEAAWAKSRAAILELQIALETGAAYTGAAEMLPQELQEFAKSDVPSVATLQSAFDAAASAFSKPKERPEPSHSFGERALAFLKDNLNARPTDAAAQGDAAVIAKARAALGQNDLARALSDLTALSAQGQEIMAQWITQAQKRLAALQAVRSAESAQKK